MKVNKQARREAKGLFRSCQRDGLLDEEKVRGVVNRLLTEKPRGYLAILTHFQRLVKLDVMRRSARIESATALSPELEESVRAALKSVYGPGLNFTFSQSPSLIGGMRVQVGSDVYDGTVKGRLAALEASF